MEVPRKIGIGILMLVPTFVGGGALWDIIGKSWTVVIIWIILMAFFTGGIISGRLPLARRV
jgi:hypothetical protein